MLDISEIPTGKFILLGMTGSVAVLSSIYLVQEGNYIPFAIVFILAFLVFFTYQRFKVHVESQPSNEYSRAFDIFRIMEPASQTRVNAWTGFLQEDVHVRRTGPIGNFVGNDDYVKKAPLYAITQDDRSQDAFISARNCPANTKCTCLPVSGKPNVTQCGYILNGIFVQCPSDCCTPACTY